MPYRGHVNNGVVVLDENVPLPDGAEVLVDLVGGLEKRVLHPEIKMFSGILSPDLDVKEGYVQSQMDTHQ